MSDFQDFSVLELFRLEVETQIAALTDGLLKLEQEATPEVLQTLMRACHSLKGAARIVGVGPAERVSHVMEDCFVAAQEGKATISQARVDQLLSAADLISRMAAGEEQDWELGFGEETDLLVAALSGDATETGPDAPTLAPEPEPVKEFPSVSAGKRTVRLAADRLDALLGLAGETQVAAGWLQDYTRAVQRLKSKQVELEIKLADLRDSLQNETPGALALSRLEEAEKLASRCSTELVEQLGALSAYDRRLFNISRRFQDEVVASRMRPFSDLAGNFPRLVRDLGRTLGKQLELTVDGHDTLVDRDILERLETPLNHLIRNSADHGIESPEVRIGNGKDEVGRIRLSASHRGGMLVVVVEDDGAGLDYEAIKRMVVEKGLGTVEMVELLDHDELEQFLFLPRFTSKKRADEISGRGVGLDLVRSSVVELGGQLHVDSELGKGIRIQLVLPLTLSVIHCLLVSVGGEPYAFPLSRLKRVLAVSRDEIQELEGRAYLTTEEAPMVWLHRVLDFDTGEPPEAIPVVLIEQNRQRFALAVDRFLGEQDLVVQRLDPRLGKVPNISAAAILEDGWPALILDVEDLSRNAARLLESADAGTLRSETGRGDAGSATRKRVLVVDDSITVREIERNLLEQQGYEVDVAVDGSDGWNTVRNADYDLVISDIDMPRMDGIELVSLIKSHARLRKIPVMIVSYKDREEDRRRGLEAGADYFLTKGSFHDQTLIQAVKELIS